MSAKSIVSVILAVLFAVLLMVWVVVMSEEGTGLYALGIVTFAAMFAVCVGHMFTKPPVHYHLF
ncbi:MAG: hypothetical protein ACOYJL_05975 [Tractidigestivibacter sp.]|jgi:hypothetical protein|uniref:hypothetical protein n=1 Tax=Tractidigestivibacter sp. TaxID=2847320 RepID=UPI003D93FA3A